MLECFKGPIAIIHGISELLRFFPRLLDLTFPNRLYGYTLFSAFRHDSILFILRQISKPRYDLILVLPCRNTFLESQFNDSLIRGSFKFCIFPGALIEYIRQLEQLLKGLQLG